MSEDKPQNPEPDATDETHVSPATSPGTADEPVGSEPLIGGSLRWRRFRMIALAALTVLGSSVLCLGMMTGTAAWYTSRSEFCHSCHIMDPYYQSWKTGTHAEVACIKCHFAPGVGEKVRGKLQGLVQLCTYLTRSEGPRPVAEVEDSSCLRSGCHEMRSLAGPLEFEGSYFDHGPHLGMVEVGDSHHEMQLRCTSCHGQMDPSVHMSVSKDTCFLCHFKDGRFNEGTGACTRCHQIPEDEFDIGGGVTFTHELVYQNGVECKSCHGDLNRGTGAVGRERCQVCHNMEEHLAQFDDYALMHELHVTENKVECLDCHAAIEHAMQPEKVVHAASDCAACHPNHHHEQVKMLTGTGALSIPAQNATMMGSRVECSACHTEKQVSVTGTIVWKASADVCTACHTSAAPDVLETYQSEVKQSLTAIENALAEIEQTLQIAELEVDALQAAKVQLGKLKHDVDFLKVGSGIHNIHYANSLTRVLIDETRNLSEQLDLPVPTIELPPSTQQFDTHNETGSGSSAE